MDPRTPAPARRTRTARSALAHDCHPLEVAAVAVAPSRQGDRRELGPRADLKRRALGALDRARRTGLATGRELEVLRIGVGGGVRASIEHPFDLRGGGVDEFELHALAIADRDSGLAQPGHGE